NADDGLCFGRLALAYWTDLFRSLELHRNLIDIQVQRFSELLPDGQSKVFQLRALEDYGGVDVDDGVAFRGHQVASMPQEFGAVGIFPARVRIGEVHSNIAQSRCAQQGIGDGVRKDISVGMPVQAEFGWNANPAQNQGPVS